MPRGRTAAAYISDAGVSYGVREDADYVAEASRGWSPFAPGTGLPMAPRGMKLRKVYGIDAQGFRGSAIVASVTAALWTGTDTSFVVSGTDNVDHVMAVTSRRGEFLPLATVPPAVA